MCGRYVSPETAAIERAWQIGRTNSNPFRRRYNVAPATLVPLLRRHDGALELTEAKWGLIPHWWKAAKPPTMTINARSEEAAEKPMWRQPYRRSRCLLPMLGWYEWRLAERPDPSTGEIRSYKQPYFLYVERNRPLCFAALMDLWTPENGAPVLTCALLTRAASESAARVHDRMPVVLPDSAHAAWLDPLVKDAREVRELIAREAINDVHFHAVSTRVNAARDDDEKLLEPVNGPSVDLPNKP